MFDIFWLFFVLNFSRPPDPGPWCLKPNKNLKGPLWLDAQSRFAEFKQRNFEKQSKDSNGAPFLCCLWFTDIYCICFSFTTFSKLHLRMHTPKKDIQLIEKSATFLSKTEVFPLQLQTTVKDCCLEKSRVLYLFLRNTASSQEFARNNFL